MQTAIIVIITATIAFWMGIATKRAPVASVEDTYAMPASKLQIDTSDTEPDYIPMNFQRALTLLFISGWIIAWSTGVLIAGRVFFSALSSGAISFFLGGWLIAAIAGWFFAANMIYRLISGKPLQTRGGRPI